MPENKFKIGITQGDTNGIGWEIILKALADPRMTELFTPVVYGSELTPEGIVVMGNEGRGVTEAVARTVTRKLFIPPWPAGRRGSESLNVAMATGIVCSEFRRRTHSEAKR